MCNLTLFMGIICAGLSISSCRSQSEEVSPRLLPRFLDSVVTLEQYLYNIDVLGQHRTVQDEDDPAVPLNSIGLLDQFIDQAMIADTSLFELTRPPYFSCSDSTVVKVAGTTDFIQIKIMADSASRQILNIIAERNGVAMSVWDTSTTEMDGKFIGYKFYLQTSWKYDHVMFRENVVVYGNMVNRYMSCYAMVYSDYFF
jgi:hypothetical protein